MLNNILGFLKSITFIDYIFFFTVVFLIVLIVSLIYFVKINEEEMKADETLKDPDNLQAIASSIKQNARPVTFTTYEKEQEDRAIISYEELLSNTGEFSVNYVDEKPNCEIEVKRVDLSNLINLNQLVEPPKMEVHVIPLKHEEEFLQALKELQGILN